MTPEQYIASLAEAEIDLSRQATERARSLRRRVFIGLGILMFTGGVAGAIFLSPLWKIGMICLMWGGTDMIFFQRIFERKV